MNWEKIWTDLLGHSALWGIDMGFWAAMAGVILIVILMNAVFWGMKPKKENEEKKA